MRLFIGVELDEETKKIITDVMGYIDSRSSMTSVDNLHLTLQFLGEVEEDDVSKMIDCIKSLKGKLNACVLEAFSFGAFKNGSIVYLAIDDGDRQINLWHNLLMEELGKVGFSNLNNEFSPHITLARKAKYNNIDELLQIKLHKIRINCNNIALFHSYREGELIYKPIYKETLN